MKRKYIKMYFYIDKGDKIKLEPIYMNYEKYKYTNDALLIEICKTALIIDGHKYIEFASRINDCEMYILN